MTDDATMGKVQLTGGLGPLPMPRLHAKALAVMGAGWELGGHVYSSDQMRLYATEAIEAERKRIAAWLEVQRNDIPATGAEFAAALRAQKI